MRKRYWSFPLFFPSSQGNATPLSQIPLGIFPDNIAQTEKLEPILWFLLFFLFTVVVLIMIWNHFLRITIRTKTDELSFSQETFRQLADNIEEGFWLMETDKQPKFIYISPAFKKIWGKCNQEFFENPMELIPTIHPEDQSRFMGTLSKLDKRMYREEIRIILPDGNIRWIRNQAFPIKDKKGKIYRVVGTTTDITESKLGYASLEKIVTERTTKLKISEARFRTLLEQSPLSTQIFSPNGNTLMINKAFENLFGASLHDLKNYNVLNDKELIDWGIMPYIIRGFDGETIEIPTIKYNTSHLNLPQGKKSIWVKGYLYPVRNEKGIINEVVIIHYDMSRQKKAEEDLIDAMTETEKASKAKSEFLSRMSHELRTPLNAILGFSQLIQMESLEDEIHQNVEEIRKAGLLLLNLINEVLDLSRIESGKMEIAWEKVQLNPLISECMALTSPLAEKYLVTIIDKISPYYSDEIIADKTRFKQIILNLLTNAVKYNKEHGTVVIQRKLTTHNRLRIEIIDSGNGLTEKEITNLFRPFERLGADKVSKEGTGIGLVITKRLIQLMEGEIGVESSPGRGSTFWIEISLYNTAPKTITNYKGINI